MSAIVIPRDRLPVKPKSPYAVATIGHVATGEPIVVLIGSPLWREIPDRLGVSVESYLALCVLPHEHVHQALEALGEEAANLAVDRRWPWSWIR